MALGATFFDALGLGVQKTPATTRWHRDRPQGRADRHRTPRHLLIAFLVFYALCAIVILGTSPDPQSLGVLLSPSP